MNDENNIVKAENESKECIHDWCRILIGVREGDYECTRCGKISSKQDLDKNREFYLD
jgi:hypothetical protein